MRVAPVALGSATHLLIALLFAWLLVVATADTGRAFMAHGGAWGVFVVWLACTLTSLCAIHLASSSTSRSTSAIRVYRWAPALWSVVVAAFPSPAVGDLGSWYAAAVPLLGVMASAGILASLLLMYVSLSTLGTTRDSPKHGLKRSLTTAIGWSGTAMSTLAASAVLVSDAGAFEKGSLITAAVLLGTGALAWAAGWCLGELYTRDLRQLAHLVDQIVRPAGSEPVQPIPVTRTDEIGELQQRLERLRRRLSRELAGYESALEKTRAADARKADFLGAVSHELRTPLNVVGGFAQLLLEGAGGPLSVAQREDVELIRNGGRHLLELINDVLDLSMIESGELRLQLTPVDMAEVTNEAVRMHGSLVRDKAVALHVEIGPDLPKIQCDRKRISQVIHNLLSNAIKFTTQGTIELRCSYDPQSESVAIRCSDTGMGIAPTDLAIVFEEYRQADCVSRAANGTGLGLAIARRIALAHGGELTAHSTVGEGSVFTLTLPLSPRVSDGMGLDPRPHQELEERAPSDVREAIA